MADSAVQVAPDSTGKLIDAQSLLDALSRTIYRQTVTVGDGNVLNNVAGVTGDMALRTVDLSSGRLLEAILREMVCIRMAMNSIANTQFVPKMVDISNVQ